MNNDIVIEINITVFVKNAILQDVSHLRLIK